MYLRLFKWEAWVEMLDNVQWWYNYDYRQRAFSVRLGRLSLTVNRRVK